MNGLYDTDILDWSEQQAALLRRLARGERVNDAIDWDNVIEEVGDVGRSVFTAVESLLEVGLRHLILCQAAKRPEPIAHWQAEALAALQSARRRYAPSMGLKLNLQGLWSEARSVALLKLADDGGGAAVIPETCPFTVSDLVRAPLDLDRLLAVLAHPGA